MNPNFQVDNNKSTSPKQRPNETIENTHDQQINNDHHNNQTDIDDDTKYLMMFHQQIIPSQTLVNIHR